MAQFECPVCGQGFEQLSRLQRHLMTSHPEQAPSAADIEHTLKGIDYPKKKDDIIRYAKENSADEDIVGILQELPDYEYRDSAEIARALGEIKSHEAKPSSQPSLTGGKRSAEYSPTSASALAKLFKGISFPASKKEIADFTNEESTEEQADIISGMPERIYNDIADIEKGISESRRNKQ